MGTDTLTGKFPSITKDLIDPNSVECKLKERKKRGFLRFFSRQDFVPDATRYFSL